MYSLDNLVKLHVTQLQHNNQFVIHYNNTKDPCYSVIAFQSYATLIAYYCSYEDKLYINWSMWDYSKTTLKHLKIFINEYTKFNYENKQQFLKFLLNDNHVKLFNER